MECYQKIFAEFEKTHKTGIIGERIVIPLIGTDKGATLELSAKCALEAAKTYLVAHPDDQVLFAFKADKQGRAAYVQYLLQYIQMKESHPKVMNSVNIDLKVGEKSEVELLMQEDAMVCPINENGEGETTIQKDIANAPDSRCKSVPTRNFGIRWFGELLQKEMEQISALKQDVKSNK